MGTGALASCSCLGWSIPAMSNEERLKKLDSKHEELYLVFTIDVALPKSSFPRDDVFASTSSATESLRTGHVLLFARAAGPVGQPLHHLPLGLLKRFVLEYRRRRSDLYQSFESDVTLVVATTTPYAPVELYITSFLLSHRVRVIFDTSKQVDGQSAVSLTLLLCARCGVNAECTCGWRHLHVIGPEMEQQSVVEFIASSLPRLPAQALPCFHLRVGESGTGSTPNFRVQAYRHDVVRPMIDCPYTVFKMKLTFGNLGWRITRRYREFVELHTRLTMLVEDSKLPQFPPKKWISPTEPIFLFHRRLRLENYLKGVFMIESLQDSVPLLVFLGVLSTTYFDHIALRSYRSQILHLQVLEFYTYPGDLILFNGRAKASILQRAVTRSEWDHVAIVVPPHEDGRLQLLEATGDGVTLTSLTARLLTYSTFHVKYLALRKLRTPLLSRAVVNDLLERFTAEVEGLPYGLSLRSILHAGQIDHAGPQGATFFCSELVAAAYKALGIISSSSNATDFWPGSFSPGHLVDVELSRHGASLSPEILLDCKMLEVATANVSRIITK